MDTLTVVAPPTISKTSPDFLFGFAPFKGIQLVFTLTNPAANPIPLTDIEFTDNLPGGLIVSTPNALSSTCSPASPTAVPGSSLISLTAPGANLATGASCTISVKVDLLGNFAVFNTTSNVTALGGTMVGPTATLEIGPSPTIILLLSFFFS
jgi:hypothetical protein